MSQTTVPAPATPPRPATSRMSVERLQRTSARTTQDRITLMFCAFEGPARIVRLHGEGEALFPGDGPYPALRRLFAEYRERNIMRVAVDRIADSCGFGVPEMTLNSQRTRMPEWVAARSDEELAAYRAEQNFLSIDGLPAIDLPN